MIKKITKLLLIILILAFSFLVFDLTKYDSSYINRNSITFNSNNLNSKIAIKFYNKFFRYYENITYKIYNSISQKQKNYWKPEDKTLRESMPSTKIILRKERNFVPGKKINSIEKNFANWPRSHGGFSSMRFSSLKKITKENVNKLKLAWVYNSKDGKKGIQANPVIYDGLVYVPTPGNHIVCLDGVTGKEIWKYKVTEGYNAAKRGLLIYKDKKTNLLKLYFTNERQLISLNAKTGQPIKTFGKNGIIKTGSSSIPPAIIDDKLVLATFVPSIEVYDIDTGKLYWKYFLRDSKEKHNKDFRGGFPWGGISADPTSGTVFLNTGNPKPNYVGVSRPGKNLFSNSVIAFDVRKKEKIWHFQETCHDMWNFDIPSTPILTTINKYGKRIDVVVSVTKLGNTLILDQYSGEPIFDYRMKLAPTSNLPGEKTCAYQPALELPEPFSRNLFSKKDVTNISESSKKYILSEIKDANYGFFKTHELNKDTIVYGVHGGAQWTGASVDPYKNIMYVTANNIAWKVGVKPHSSNLKFQYTEKKAVLLKDSEGYPGVKPPWGTLTALNLNSGKIKWQIPLGHYEKLKNEGIITGTENYGGATATLGGLVFAAGTIDKFIRAFDAINGNELWSYKLPYIGSAPPSSYEINDEQYIIIPASGGITLKANYGDLIESGDAFVAFKLDD